MSEGARRREILRAAERLLRRYGAAKTTVAEVAREANIGVGTVYLEFPSKEAIVEELSAARHEALLDVMRHAAVREGTYRERLASLFNARTARLLEFADEGEHTCELVQCMRPSVRAAQARYARAELELLCGLLRAGAEAGQLCVAPHGVEALARAVIGAYAGFSAPAVFAMPRQCVRAELEEMHWLVIDGLAARGCRPAG